MTLELISIVFLLATLLSLASTYLMIAWFDGAKFFIEYMELFGFSEKIPHIKTFIEMKKQGAPMTYLDYIQDNYNTFLARLVTCEKCMPPWVSASLLTISLIPFLFIDWRMTVKLFLVSPLIVFTSSFLSYKLFKSLK